MFELQGKYNKAKVFADIVDDNAVAQVIELLNQPFSEGSQIRMMPDIHAGAGCTIGTTMTVTDKICPNLVGVDIGCGMLVTYLMTEDVDFAKLDAVIHEHIPAGFAIREEPHPFAARIERDLQELRCAQHIDIERAVNSIGTLGGGNHFIEVNSVTNDMHRASAGKYCLVIHTGSRHLGKQVAEYYQRKAVANLHTVDKNAIRSTIEELKAQGRQKDIETAIKALKPKYSSVPDALCWLEGDDFRDYMHDIIRVQAFAKINRAAIAEEICRHMGWGNAEQLYSFTTKHNYIDTECYPYVLRKGAVSAKEDQLLIIPLNMRDGSLICKGLGNRDWNCSAPHGAGRIMSRAQAKTGIDLDEYKASMDGIYTTSVNMSTIDESPMAYKPMESIISNIEDTVTIIDRILPVYNFKAGE